MMINRLKNWVGRMAGPGFRSRPLLLIVGAVVGFVAIVGAQLEPPDPESRLPGSQRLAALIQRTQDENESRKLEVKSLQAKVDTLGAATRSQKEGTQTVNSQLGTASLDAGMVALTGTGFTVTLNDSSLNVAPTGNVNDLVIHSQDVQAVVNGLWASGAEAVSVNGERIVSSSAVLCVGNTLLINGDVFSPPYQTTAIGADRTAFTNEPLVKQLRSDADRFSLQFSVGKDEQSIVPAYSGPTTPKYAQVSS